jgi:hypothetical protein
MLASKVLVEKSRIRSEQCHIFKASDVKGKAGNIITCLWQPIA